MGHALVYLSFHPDPSLLLRPSNISHKRAYDEMWMSVSPCMPVESVSLEVRLPDRVISADPSCTHGMGACTPPLSRST